MKREYGELEQVPALPEQGKRSRAYGEVPLEEVTLTIRVLLAVKDSGLIIGKQGGNIKKIRESSGAEVRLADAPPNSSRRAASCSGGVAQVTAALISILELLHGHGGEAPPEERPVPETEPVITLLIGNEVVGACIGKGGTVIAHTREATQANIKVSEKGFEGSTEKTVELKGGVQSVAPAIEMIVKQVATMAEKETRAVPLTKVEWGSSAALAAFHAEAESSRSPYGGYGGGGGYGGYGGYGPPAGGGEKRQVVVPVATGLAGSLIGKGGNVIRRIREASGAEIKIADPAPGSDTRNVSITGNEMQTQHAVSLVYSALGQPSPYGPPPVPTLPPVGGPGGPPPYYGARGYY